MSPATVGHSGLLVGLLDSSIVEVVLGVVDPVHGIEADNIFKTRQTPSRTTEFFGREACTSQHLRDTLLGTPEPVVRG